MSSDCPDDRRPRGQRGIPPGMLPPTTLADGRFRTLDGVHFVKLAPGDGTCALYLSAGQAVILAHIMRVEHANPQIDDARAADALCELAKFACTAWMLSAAEATEMDNRFVHHTNADRLLYSVEELSHLIACAERNVRAASDRGDLREESKHQFAADGLIQVRQRIANPIDRAA